MSGADGEPIPQGGDDCGTGGVSEEDPFAIELAERARHRMGRLRMAR